MIIIICYASFGISSFYYHLTHQALKEKFFCIEHIQYQYKLLSYYLPIAGGRIIGFIPFPRVLVLCEKQSVSSRIWTRIAVFISYGDNDYTTGTSNQYKLLVEPNRYMDRLGQCFSNYLM